ncbi:MAG TPA: DUF5674 family protein [Ignavibacteria bacterium]|nr:DUF5674 family protein [Ignavibacteria bacterium]
MKIIRERISKQELQQIADEDYGNYVKAVVDIENEIIAIGGEMHSDEEALLMDNGSKQNDLWGINIYPEKPNEERVEFDSMINMRPSWGNRSRGVENPEIKVEIIEVVNKLIE